MRGEGEGILAAGRLGLRRRGADLPGLGRRAAGPARRRRLHVARSSSSHTGSPSDPTSSPPCRTATRSRSSGRCSTTSSRRLKDCEPTPRCGTGPTNVEPTAGVLGATDGARVIGPPVRRADRARRCRSRSTRSLPADGLDELIDVVVPAGLPARRGRGGPTGTDHDGCPPTTGSWCLRLEPAAMQRLDVVTRTGRHASAARPSRAAAGAYGRVPWTSLTLEGDIGAARPLVRDAAVLNAAPGSRLDRGRARTRRTPAG